MATLNFGKLCVLFSSAAKEAAGRALCEKARSCILKNRQAITAELGQEPHGFIVCHGEHVSDSDNKTHLTVDAYAQDANGNDVPIGVLHIYTDGSGYEAFTNPRTKAMEVYKHIAESSSSK
ncbi:hypothetical protein BJ912DRAFT_1049736 [Pholiota molesta]|nr:hypothetical protein BJ912DRAFT_1049736 [Pholiota molesta]